MSLQHIFDQARADWLLHTGDPHTYLSVKTGRMTQVLATTEIEVEVLDDNGLTVRHPAGYIPSDAIPEVTVGDILVNKVTGSKWTVQEKYEDNGTFMSLYLLPED